MSWAEVHAVRVRLLAEGRCRDCGRPKDGAAQRCSECQAKDSARQRRRRLVRLEFGVCTRCGRRTHDPTRRQCVDCRAEVRVYVQQGRRARLQMLSGEC